MPEFALPHCAIRAIDLQAAETSIGLDGSATQVIKIFSPPKRASGQILTGEPREAVEKLLELLKKEITG